MFLIIYYDHQGRGLLCIATVTMAIDWTCSATESIRWINVHLRPKGILFLHVYRGKREIYTCCCTTKGQQSNLFLTQVGASSTIRIVIRRIHPT